MTTTKPAGKKSVEMTTDERQALIQLLDITKQFRRRGEPVTAMQDLTLEIPRGEFTCIVGPSGCGKSTLLNMTAGLMEPSRGQVVYDGKPVNGPNTKVGYITQKDTLLPWRTVRANIGLALEIRRYPQSERRHLVDEMISLVGLDGFAESYPAQLSGGMRKRVILGRTLIYGPETLLADEPFGALDAQLKLIMQQELLRITRDTGTTVLFVTHDIAEAIALGDRVVVLSNRPARIRASRMVPLGEKRDVSKVRFSTEFGTLYEELWETLAEDLQGGDEV